MAIMTLTASEWKKIQRDIAQLKRRVEKLEKKKTTRRSAAGKKNGVNGHRRRIPKVYEATNPRVHQIRETRAVDPLDKFIGVIDLGHPLGSDNVQIDRNLATEYGSTHAEE